MGNVPPPPYILQSEFENKTQATHADWTSSSNLTPAAIVEVKKRAAQRVGKSKPTGKPRAMRYIGPDKKLKGETALVSESSESGYCAQFDDPAVGFGYGWWPVDITEWEARYPDEAQED